MLTLNSRALQLFAVLLLMSMSFGVLSEAVIFNITLKNHAFVPEEITVPRDTKVQLVIDNQDAEPEEFDSFDLNREKVIFPGRKARLFIGPLQPGQYEFFGEFHPDTARGRVIVKEAPDAN
jgi:heme/copper-type cytochrome/quinol oxidase subunit 2